MTLRQAAQGFLPDLRKYIMNIVIKDKPYPIRYTVRAMILFEQMRKKSFSLDTLTDQYYFVYCLILATNKDCTLTFDDLLDAIDEQPRIMEDFGDWLNAIMEQRAMYDSAGDDKKKA